MGYSPEWLAMAKHSIASLLPRFSSTRMVGEYLAKFYLPATRQGRRYAESGYDNARKLALWKAQVRRNWDNVRLRRLDTPSKSIAFGEGVKVELGVHLNGLKPEDVVVELLIGRLLTDEEMRRRFLRAVKDPAIIAKKNALDEAEAASEQSLQDLQKEFSARQGVLPGSSKFAEGKILYDQGKGLKSVLAWTKESGPLEYIQRKESLESLPEIAGRTNVRSGWWKGAVDHYQVYRKDGGLLDYSVIRSNIDGQELWSWVPTTH
jgi:hypothetical protein